MTVVLKFGGTSVANGVRIRNVAKLIAARYVQATSNRTRVAVVVSAMAGTTDQLSRLLEEMGGVPSAEDDVVLSSGEALSTALLAIALTQIGMRARSFLGWQLPILTDRTPRQARILSVGTEHLNACLDQGIVPVIAGFQGISPDNRLTTLGRGGSDTTAVAVAAALGADRCDIYTDVDGVYAADPRVVPFAHKWRAIPYDSMIAMAGAGAKVLQVRSVETAAQHHVPVRVLSSFVENEGTLITSASQAAPIEVLGIASSRNVSCFSLVEGDGETLGERLRAQDIPFDFLEAERGVVVETAFEKAIEAVLEESALTKKDHGWAKISVVGEAVQEGSPVAPLIFETCNGQGIPFKKCVEVPQRISFLVPRAKEALVVCALYKTLESLLPPKT